MRNIFFIMLAIITLHLSECKSKKSTSAVKSNNEEAYGTIFSEDEKPIPFIEAISKNTPESISSQILDSIYSVALRADIEKRGSVLKVNINHFLKDVLEENFYQKVDTNAFRTPEGIEFAKDTFKIYEANRICQEIDYTTIGIMLALDFLFQSEMDLIDIYYNKLLANTKNLEEKELLIKSQRKWLESFNLDTEYSNLLIRKQEGSIWRIINYVEPKNRLSFLFDCYNMSMF